MGGDDYTSDPAKIREVGTEDLPNLAERLRTIRQALIDTEDAWTHAFRQDRAPIAEMYAETQQQWDAACSWFFVTLGEAATRIDRAADALVTIADNLEVTDESAAVLAEGSFEIVEVP